MLCVGGVPAVLSVRSDGVLLLERLNILETFWKKEQRVNRFVPNIVGSGLYIGIYVFLT